jgi:acetyl-CoA carboxylase carboxyl transferase subunit beta
MAARELRQVQEEAESIWLKCTKCQEILFRKEVERRLFVCPKCGAHLRLTVEQRLLMIVDRGSFVEHDATLSTIDALGFIDRKPYSIRLAEACQKTGRREAVVCGTATIHGRSIALGVFDFTFLGGSMGSVVGEKLTRIVEHASFLLLQVEHGCRRACCRSCRWPK